MTRRLMGFYYALDFLNTACRHITKHRILDSRQRVADFKCALGCAILYKSVKHSGKVSITRAYAVYDLNIVIRLLLVELTVHIYF